MAGTCLLLAATACGDDDDPPSSPQDGASPASQDESAAADDGDGAGDTADAEVTLGDLLGTEGTIEERAGQVRETERQRQEIIRDCMVEQGFDYVVHVVAGQVESPFGLPTNLTEEEFRRQYGYGLATGFESAMNRPPQEGPPDAADNPNVAIVAAMSAAERTAYEQALHGSENPDGAPGGCEGEALAATDRMGMLMTEFGDQLDDLWTRVEADSRVVDAQQAWVTCMDEAGYPYPDEQAIRTEVMRRLNPLNDAVMGEDVPDGVIDYQPGITMTGDQRTLLADIRSFELAVANADQDCRADLDETREEVQAEYEASFVDTNRDRLRELFPDAGL